MRYSQAAMGDIILELLTSLPALLRIAIVLCGILTLLRLKFHIGLALVLGSLGLAVLFGMGPLDYLRAIFAALVSSRTLFLAMLVLGIMVLSNAMNHFGQIKRLILRFRELVGESRLMLVAFPAMIGLLPMPGGAVFSAPMVGEASRNSQLSPERKSAINYWFRHVWEFWWPLYPGVIVALALTPVSPVRFMLLGMPMSLVALGAGILVTLRNAHLGGGGRQLNITPRGLRRFLMELVPVFLVIGTLLALGPLASRVGRSLGTDSLMISRAPILLGVILAIGWVVKVNRGTPRELLGILGQWKIWSMPLLVVGLMIFNQTLEASGTVLALKEELMAWHIPLPALVALLPFIAGVITGIAVGFVGVSFPVVIALLESSGIHGAELAPYAFLAFAWGYAGMMASPVHLCLLLTCDYFGARMGRIYRDLALMVACVMVASTLLFLLYRL